MSKKKIKQPVLYFVMVFLLAFGLILSLLWPDRAYSNVENRPLATGASFSWNALLDGQTGKDLNKTALDQVPFRNAFFHWGYFLRTAAGQREINDVFVGKNALLANPSPEENNAIARNVSAINVFAQQSGIRCTALICPGAATIQKDRLPSDAPVFDNTPLLDTISKDLNAASQADIRQILQAHQSEPVFYKTDHHWTTLGAGYGAQGLLEAMGMEMNLDDYETMLVSEDFEGTLAHKTGCGTLKDRIEIAVSKNNPKYIVTWADGSQTTSIYNEKALGTADEYQVFLGQNQSLIRIDTDVQTDRTLLLFKDSYANSAIQYLLPYFSSITIIDARYYYDSLESLILTNLFSDCAFIYSADTFVTDPSLASVLEDYSAAWQAAQTAQ